VAALAEFAAPLLYPLIVKFSEKEAGTA